MKLTRKLAGYKTFIASGLVSFAGTIAAIPDQLQQLGIDWKTTLPQAIPIKNVGLLLIGLGVLFALLRMVTRTPPLQAYPEVPPDLMKYAPNGPDPIHTDTHI